LVGEDTPSLASQYRSQAAAIAQIATPQDTQVMDRRWAIAIGIGTVLAAPVAAVLTLDLVEPHFNSGAVLIGAYFGAPALLSIGVSAISRFSLAGAILLLCSSLVAALAVLIVILIQLASDIQCC
jgi:hypothetical protein